MSTADAPKDPSIRSASLGSKNLADRRAAIPIPSPPPSDAQNTSPSLSLPIPSLNGLFSALSSSRSTLPGSRQHSFPMAARERYADTCVYSLLVRISSITCQLSAMFIGTAEGRRSTSSGRFNRYWPPPIAMFIPVLSPAIHSRVCLPMPQFAGTSPL